MDPVTDLQAMNEQRRWRAQVWSDVAFLAMAGVTVSEPGPYREAIIKRVQTAHQGTLTGLVDDAHRRGIDLSSMDAARAIHGRLSLDSLLAAIAQDRAQEAQQAAFERNARIRRRGLPDSDDGKLAPTTKQLGRDRVAQLRKQLKEQ